MRTRRLAFLLTTALGLAPHTVWAQSPLSPPSLYGDLKAFNLDGRGRTVEGLTLQRDRAELTFNGTFYFEAPVDGVVYGAVFLGEGTFRVEVPDTAFERAQVQRMIGEDAIESDFSRAVFRFTDDTFDLIGPALEGFPSERAADLAEDFEPRFLEETGANLSARLALSILNGEDPGFFVAEFDGGRHDRFTLLLDRQGRIPGVNFGINGGEKGMVFSHRNSIFGNDVWAAFYSSRDYDRGTTDYSDAFDLIDAEHYEMDVDVRDPRDHLGVVAEIRAVSKVDGLRAIPFAVGESLSEYESARRNREMRLTGARLASGGGLFAVQEEWESGLTVFLAEPVDSGEDISIVLELEGDFMLDSTSSRATQNFYPSINGEWYPRHGYLDRATYELTFHHNKNYEVASTGIREAKQVSEEDDDASTHWTFDHPVALVTFAVGLFDIYEESEFVEDFPVSFYSIRAQRIDEAFIAAEMINAINYFTATFGPYPYGTLAGVQHPMGFGQGFPSLLLVPAADTSNRNTYAFLAHEISHQWWGNVVAWRSYRDQWLSEGFAEYSGMLYTGLRGGASAERDLIEIARRSLIQPPHTTGGVGDGRLVDIGPLIMGSRLNSSQTQGAYQTLVYQKGALVLRMLHFLLSDPLTGDDAAVFEMMSDFVETHRNGWASTETFRRVANAHFAGAPLARMTGLNQLDWFFNEWVYQSYLPSYRLEHRLERAENGNMVARGTLFQEGVPENFLMALLVVLRFDGDLQARWPVFAVGPESSFEIPLPMEPDRIELDPDWWVLSEETSTRKR